jgi:hypothetical protein
MPEADRRYGHIGERVIAQAYAEAVESILYGRALSAENARRERR